MWQNAHQQEESDSEKWNYPEAQQHRRQKEIKYRGKKSEWEEGDIQEQMREEQPSSSKGTR